MQSEFTPVEIPILGLYAIYPYIQERVIETRIPDALAEEYLTGGE